MKNPRFTGLLLLLTGVLVLMGNTLDVLPPAAFWAGLLTYPIGGYLFFMGSREALERVEKRATRAMSSRVSSDPGQAFAKLQERSQPPHSARPKAGESDPQPVEPESRIVESLRAKPAAKEAGPAEQDSPVAAEPLALHDLQEEDTGSETAPDASFPVEVQEPQSLADQIQKLDKLQRQGVISAEEYAVAKAKLRG